MYTTIQLIEKNKDKLTPQQYKTLKGQCKAGDIQGAIKGFYKLMRRSKRGG
jgi:hypothetical protein